MPRLEMMLLVLLILPLPDFNVAGGQAVQGDGQGDGMDRYLQRGDRDVYTTCHIHEPNSPWGRCCLTKMCGNLCCNHMHCRCVSDDMGTGCACSW